jgi:hypothetical protein
LERTRSSTKDREWTAVVVNRILFGQISKRIANGVSEVPRKETPTQTLRMVLASPGDVIAERKIAGDIVEEINRGVAAALGISLELSRWETDAFPGFHVDGPQGLIDPILRIDESDILVGIFWKRFGTPTANADSGTAHEFEIARKSWLKNARPQIMMYFNQRPYAPASSAEG